MKYYIYIMSIGQLSSFLLFYIYMTNCLYFHGSSHIVLSYSLYQRLMTWKLKQIQKLVKQNNFQIQLHPLHHKGTDWQEVSEIFNHKSPLNFHFKYLKKI